MNSDITLFQGTAKYYSTYREGYDELLYAEIIKKCKLSKTSIVLDIGTGTGTIAHNLASSVQKVFALDPSKEMLNEAKQIAEEKGLENIIFMEDVGEHIDLYSEFKNIDLVTFGASLHWIQDIDGIFRKVGHVLKSRGWLVIQFGALVQIWTKKPEHDWRYDVTNVVKKYLGEDRRAGNGLYKEKTSRKGDSPFEKKLLGHKELYTNFCRIEIPHTKSWSPEKIIGFLYSTSFARKDFFGKDAEGFENDITDLFMRRNMSEWEETEIHIAIMAQRT